MPWSGLDASQPRSSRTSFFAETSRVSSLVLGISTIFRLDCRVVRTNPTALGEKDAESAANGIGGAALRLELPPQLLLVSFFQLTVLLECIGVVGVAGADGTCTRPEDEGTVTTPSRVP